jgi:hypothetical protein
MSTLSKQRLIACACSGQLREELRFTILFSAELVAHLTA